MDTGHVGCWPVNVLLQFGAITMSHVASRESRSSWQRPVTSRLAHACMYAYAMIHKRMTRDGWSIYAHAYMDGHLAVFDTYMTLSPDLTFWLSVVILFWSLLFYLMGSGGANFIYLFIFMYLLIFF